jgi:hypothetical protein
VLGSGPKLSSSVCIATPLTLPTLSNTTHSYQGSDPTRGHR